MRKRLRLFKQVKIFKCDVKDDAAKCLDDGSE
jgi:hypothetical protein